MSLTRDNEQNSQNVTFTIAIIIRALKGTRAFAAIKERKNTRKWIPLGGLRTNDRLSGRGKFRARQEAHPFIDGRG